MTGTIIYEPPTPTACERGDCADKPRADQYRDGTLWECDHCGAQWVVWSGAQYNEAFSAWRLHRAGSARRAPHVSADPSFCPPLAPGDDETCTHTPACPTRPGDPS